MLIADLAQDVITSLTDDLRRRPWRGLPNPVAGHCYVASETLYHLGLQKIGYRPMFLRAGDFAVSHWFLCDGLDVVDVTAAQFADPVKYADARRRSFLTDSPSKRAVILMNRVCHLTDKSVSDIIKEIAFDYPKEDHG